MVTSDNRMDVVLAEDLSLDEANYFLKQGWEMGFQYRDIEPDPCESEQESDYHNDDCD